EEIDRRFEAMDSRFEGMDRRFEAMDGKVEGIDRRFEAMDGKFEGMEGRLSGRLTKVEVGLESLGRDLRLVAELVTTNGRRIDENRLAIEGLTEKVELNGVGIRAIRRRVAALEDHLRAV
ncbi:MAG: hypothetical protein P8188_03285, partial [Gemmatimonadota bacterium]